MACQRRQLQSVSLCVLIGCGWSLIAEAQSVKPDVPRDLNADSAAEMKDTVNDPRIGDALARQNGIWKSVVPPVKMKGAFDDHDPIGLVANKLIPADCSLNWTDPDTHKLYCFTSATSMVFFLESPHTYLGEAQHNWLHLTGKPST
jgi:hypothetical protein